MRNNATGESLILVFQGPRCIVRAPLPEAALAASKAMGRHSDASVLAFDGRTGAVVDLDLRGEDAAILARYAPSPAPRGRPKLGVVAREVTLLPRHWDWLASQGGASAVLRRLIDAAERADGGKGAETVRRESAYRFMAAMAGDLPGFEEASRALFRGDEAGLNAQMIEWPADVSETVRGFLGVSPAAQADPPA